MKAFTAVMYHYVRPMPDPEFPYLKVCGLDRFDAQLDYLQENYRIISWPEVHASLRGEVELPDRACLLTFDDGLRDGYLHIFPRLRARGISGLFFAMARRPEEGLAPVQMLQLLANHFSDPAEFKEILFTNLSPAQKKDFDGYCERMDRESPPDRFGEGVLRTMRNVINMHMFRELNPVLELLCRERIGDPQELSRAFYLGDTDIREMVAGGMYFGGHGVMHYRMSRLTEEELHKEIGTSREYLAAYASGPLAFSYPYGDYDDRVMSAVKEAGFAAAFTAREGSAKSLFSLPRVDTIHLPPPHK